MFFGIFILIRILFAASMVFIIGYVFGNFSKKPVLAAITKVAAILAIVLFISVNILSFRASHWHHNYRNNWGNYQRDSTINR